MDRLGLVVIFTSGVGTYGHIKLSACDALIERQNVVGGRLEVTSGVVRLGNVAVVALTTVYGLEEIRHSVKSTE